MGVIYTAIPDDELAVFQSLEDVKVVFDVGARDDVDYLILKPGIELHAFEPNPFFFSQLKVNVKDTPNVHLNNYGLGDEEGHFKYDEGAQATREKEEGGVLVRRLDDYVKEKGIRQIDFLKIDVEGYEWQVLQGGQKTLDICRYVQYEENGPLEKISALLKDKGFDLYYIGGRNQFGVRKGEKMPTFPLETQEGGLTDKSAKNYL